MMTANVAARYVLATGGFGAPRNCRSPSSPGSSWQAWRWPRTPAAHMAVEWLSASSTNRASAGCCCSATHRHRRPTSCFASRRWRLRTSPAENTAPCSACRQPSATAHCARLPAPRAWRRCRSSVQDRLTGPALFSIEYKELLIMSLVLVVAFIVLMILGMPVGHGLILGCAAAVLWDGGVPLSSLRSRFSTRRNRSRCWRCPSSCWRAP